MNIILVFFTVTKFLVLKLVHTRKPNRLKFNFNLSVLKCNTSFRKSFILVHKVYNLYILIFLINVMLLFKTKSF